MAAAPSSQPLQLTEAELQSLQTLTGLSRDQFIITRFTLQRFTLAQLKSITVALASRLPPRFALRGTKAVQVGQLANALFETPAPRATPSGTSPRSGQPSAPAAAALHVPTPFAGAPTPNTSLTAPERALIRDALHPYYEQVSTVAVSRVSALRLANSSHHQLRFQLDPYVLAQLDGGKGAFGLLIRFFKDTNDIQWWNDFHVILNGKTVDTRSLQKKIRSNPKYQSFITPYPAEIGSKIVAGTNLIEFYYHNWATTAILVIDFVKKRGLQDLVSQVPPFKSPVTFSSSTGGDEELEELKQKLPLTCPITLGRMAIPAKGRHCSHIHAFDLSTYISFCNQAQVWNCPICQKPLPFHQLVRDELLTTILAATGSEVTSVELDPTGRWSLGSESIPIDAGDESDGDEGSTKRPHSGEGASQARKAPRIDSMLRAANTASPGGSSGSHAPTPAAATPGRSDTIIIIDSD